MSGGPNQHYLPRFLQKPFGIRPGLKEIWTFGREAPPERRRMKNVGVSENFYSDPAEVGVRTLDDEISEAETIVSEKLKNIRECDIGVSVASIDAAEIVYHLLPRTAHVRANLESALRMMANNVGRIVDDECCVRSLIGLDSDEPGDAFRKNVSARLAEIDAVTETGIPEELLHRVIFVEAKERFADLAGESLPQMRHFVNLWLEASDFVAREAHNQALGSAASSTPRYKFLQGLSWSIQSAQSEGAILPDCAVLAVFQSGDITPAMFADFDEIIAVALPITPEKILIGSLDGNFHINNFDLNYGAARSSHDFFVARNVSEYILELHKIVGERSTSLVDEGVLSALKAYLPKEHEPKDKALPLVPVEIVDGFGDTWECDISIMGCGDGDSVQYLLELIKKIVENIGASLPLNRLDGITIASDYRGAINSLMQVCSGAPRSSVLPEDVGQGVARTLPVKRGDVWKERVVLDAGVAFALLSEDDAVFEWALYIIARQLVDVFVSSLFARHLPDVWMRPIDDVLHRFLYPIVHPALVNYLSSHIGAGFSGKVDVAVEKRQVLAAALNDMMKRGLKARLEYRFDGDMERLISVVRESVTYVLQFSADLLGHCAALGCDPVGGDVELVAALEHAGLRHWFPMFGDQLERFRTRLGRWESFDEFVALDVHVERLMWRLGMFPWLAPEGVRVEIPLSSDIEQLSIHRDD